MISVFPSTPLEQVIKHRKEFITISDTEVYKRCRVKLHAQGIVLRDTVYGSEIKTKEQQVCQSGEFLVAEIDAKVGGFGIVPQSLEGAIVSSHYFLFTIDDQILDEKFLHYFIRTPDFREQVAAQGSTNYAAIRPQHVLNYKIPLPSLPKQKEIVAHINELAAKINEARGLRSEAQAETDSLIGAELYAIFERGIKTGWKRGVLGDYVAHDCYGTSEKTGDDKSGTPILRMGNIQAGRLDLRDLKYLHINKKERDKLILKKGDIVVNRTNSAELVGKCAVFDEEGEYGFASYLIRLRLDTERANPYLVAAYINSPAGRAYMFSNRRQMTGQANVNATKLKALPIGLPVLNEQQEILAHLNNLKKKVDLLKQLQSDTAAELDAMLPSVLSKAFKGEL